MVNENDRPPSAPPEEINDDQPPMMGNNSGGRKMPNMGGGGGLVRTAIVALVVSLVVVLVVNMTGAMWVSKTDFTSNLGNIANTIDQLKSADKTTGEKLNAINVPTTGSINTLVSDAVSKATSGVSTQISTMTSTVNGFQQKIESASSQASSAANQISSLNNQISSLKSDNESLKNQVASLKSSSGSSGVSTTDFNNLKDKVKTLEDKVATLSSSGTTVTGSGGSSGGSSGTGSSTNGQVTATVISYSYANIFNGNTNAPSALPFTPQNYGTSATPPASTATLVSVAGASPVWLNNVTSQNFQIQLQNGTGKTLSNIQLSLTFVWIKSDGTQVTLPYASSYSINSMGNPQWTSTSYDQTYASWSTGTNNTILGSIFPFTQAPGTSSYYSTLSVTFPTVTTNATALTLPALTWYAVPIIKVVGYSTN